jgi:hypothetical protein
MTITSNEYEVLKRSVAKIYETSDLAESLKSRAKEDAALAIVMREFFDDNEEQCAEFVRQHSIINTSIVASVEVSYARLTASFDSNEELTEDNARDFVLDNFSFAYVNADDDADFEVEDVDLQFTYRMRDFESVSRAA